MVLAVLAEGLSYSRLEYLLFEQANSTDGHQRQSQEQERAANNHHFIGTIMKTVRVHKLEIQDADGTIAEFVGGGDGSTPAPDSVTSETIVNEGVKKEDLEKDIQDKLDVLDESNVISEEDLEEDWAQAMEQAGLDVNPITNPDSATDEDFDNEWEHALHNAGMNLNPDPSETPEAPNLEDDV